MHGVPVYVSESKRRCNHFGLDPSQFPVPKEVLSECELRIKQVQYGEFLSVARFFAEKTMGLLAGTPILMLFTDDEGYIIEIYGDETMKTMLFKTGIAYGVQLNEKDMGTNAVYIALQEKKPIQLIGEDHYYYFLHTSSCYCVPYSFPEINYLSGTVSIMTTVDYHSPYQLPLLSNMVGSIEREILLHRKNQKQNLLTDVMLDTIRNGIIITDTFGYVTEINQFAEQVMNCRSKEIIGRSIFSFEPIGQYIYGALNQGLRYEEIELSFKSANSKKCKVLLDALPMYDVSGELIGAYAQFRDMTDRYELEQQVIVSEKYSAIGKLAAGLAHEIRNPLTAIMGFMQLLHEQSKSSGQANSYLPIIYDELQRINKLVSDFVLIAKPSVPEPTVCILQDLLTEVIVIMNSQAILKNIRIDTKLYDVSLTLCIDPTQIKQVIINLLQNALDAIGEQTGTVCVQVEPDASHQNAVIRIQDNGIGMTDEELKQIFQPFFTTKEEGVGIGLSISYRIIENHQGTIAVYSEKGVGTTFTVQLPIMESTVYDVSS